MSNFEFRRESLSSPRSTSAHELERILTEQEIEKEWWSAYPAMKNEEDIELALMEGRAVPIPEHGEGYRISEKVPQMYRVLTPDTRTLLEDVARAWQARLRKRQIATEEVFLVISSLARTLDYQEQLKQKGYPAADDSTHTKLGAFDIATAWFKQNRPDLLEALDEVLEELAASHVFNRIDEPEVGAYHMALNPTVVQKREELPLAA